MNGVPRTLPFAVLLAGSLALPVALAGQGPAYLVDDLVTTRDASVGLDPILWTVLHDRLFFFGSDPLTGREPWTSDGTPDGTRSPPTPARAAALRVPPQAFSTPS